MDLFEFIVYVDTVQRELSGTFALCVLDSISTCLTVESVCTCAGAHTSGQRVCVQQNHTLPAGPFHVPGGGRYNEHE